MSARNQISRSILDHIDVLFSQYPEHFVTNDRNECVVLDCDETLICHSSLKRIVCPECGGEGTELRGGLKGAVFYPEDFQNDPEFAENYFGGTHDVPCSKCKGKRVIDIPDASLWIDEDVIMLVYKMLQDTHDAVLEAEVEAAAEARWGC